MYPADERPAGLVVLVVLFALQAAVWFAFSGLLLVVANLVGSAPILAKVLWVAFLLPGLLYVRVAQGLWGRASWSWSAAIVLSVFGLASFPIGLVLPPVLLFAPLGTPTSIAALIVLSLRHTRMHLGHYPSFVGERTYDEYLLARYPSLARARSAAALTEAGSRAVPADRGAFCAGCGAALDAGDAFCGRCGARSA